MADSPMSRFQLWRAMLPPGLRVLLSVNLALVALAVVGAILAAFRVPALAQLLEYLALPGAPEAALARPWTPLTYAFTTRIAGGGVWALIGVAFVLYWLAWLGRDLEAEGGAHRLVGLYVGSALFGAAVALGLAALSPSAPGVRPFYDGAWGPATAVLAATAVRAPDRPVGLFLLGVVPMKWIAVGFVVLSLLAPNAALLGAALFGALFGAAWNRGIDLAAWARPLFAVRRAPARTSRPARTTAVARPAPTARPGRTARAAAPEPPPDIDRILDKILDHGVDSLTDEERRILKRAGRG